MAGRRLGQIRLIAELREAVSKLETRMAVEYSKRLQKTSKRRFGRFADPALEAWSKIIHGITYTAQELDELADVLAKRHPEQAAIAAQFTAPEPATNHSNSPSII